MKFNIGQMSGNYSFIVTTTDTREEAEDFILTECYSQLREEETPPEEQDDTLELFCSYFHIEEVPEC